MSPGSWVSGEATTPLTRCSFRPLRHPGRFDRGEVASLARLVDHAEGTAPQLADDAGELAPAAGEIALTDDMLKIDGYGADERRDAAAVGETLRGSPRHVWLAVAVALGLGVAVLVTVATGRYHQTARANDVTVEVPNPRSLS